MRTAILIAALIGALAATAFCDPGTVTESPLVMDGVRRVAITWTSGTNNYAAANLATRGGTLRRVTFNPDSTAVPSNSYDVTLTDAAGIDMLSGLGANLASNAASSVIPLETAQDDATITNGREFVYMDALSLTVTNVGNAKSGVITLILR